MNSDNVIQLLQKGFRITLGATTSLVETLQDPQKRDQSFSSLRSTLAELSEEWAEKGEITELEARNFVDTLLAQRTTSSYPTSTTTSTASPPPTTPATPPEVQLELQELTNQIAAIRAEVENLRTKDASS